MLQDYFIETDDTWRIPDSNNEADIQQKRKDRLLRDFRRYLDDKSKRLKDVRVEVLRVGFYDCFERKLWQPIINVGARIPEDLLHEDEKLLMYYDTAQARIRAQPKTLLF